MKLLFTVCLLLLTGCANMMVPKTEISGTINGQPFSYSGPKNVALSGFRVEVDGTNRISLSISNLTTVMDPAVITTSGQVFVDTINAVGAVAAQAAAAGAKTAAKP